MTRAKRKGARDEKRTVGGKRVMEGKATSQAQAHSSRFDQTTQSSLNNRFNTLSLEESRLHSVGASPESAGVDSVAPEGLQRKLKDKNANGRKSNGNKSVRVNMTQKITRSRHPSTAKAVSNRKIIHAESADAYLELPLWAHAREANRAGRQRH